jgi:hypothetical protein
MTTFATGNPIGSTSPKDLYDNAQNLDNLVLGPLDYYPDRLGVPRLSYRGMENQANTALANTGFEEIGDYDSGPLTITRRNQVFTKGGQFYGPGAALSLPYTTVNNWTIDQPKFVNRGDFVLRQDLAAIGGAARIGARARNGTLTNVQALLDQNQTQLISVKNYGAKGDGVTNDTAAFAAAINAATAAKYTGILIPGGNYVVDGGWNLPAGALYLSFYGEGRSTRLKFSATQPLFTAPGGVVSHLSFRDFVIDNTGASTAENNACFWFPEGNTESEFRNISLLPNLATNKTCPGFYVCGAGKTNDTVCFTDCFLQVNKIGVSLGAGSSVWWTGGRIIGFDPKTENSVGIRLNGQMGGVWLTAVDVIGLTSGVLIQQASGVNSNREIFLVDACLDSCQVGLNILDAASYTCWTGVWASSCDAFNVNFAPTGEAAVLNMVGGTIFNAGASDSSQTYQNSGLSVNRYGRLLCNGITFRNNKNRAVSFSSGDRVNPAIIMNSHFFANGSTRSGSCQAYLAGRAILRNNHFEVATVPNVIIDPGSIQRVVISGNEGLKGLNLRAGPAIGSSGSDTTNNTGQKVTGYFRGGSISSYWLNGTPVYELGSSGPANVQLTLEPGDTYRIVYSGAPSVNWYFD